MVDPIQFPPSISGVGPVRPQSGLDQPSEVQGKDFKEILLENLNEVNRLQTEADEGVQRLMTGETNNVAEVFAAVNSAGIAFDLLMEIRNKLTEAYQEIQRMQV